MTTKRTTLAVLMIAAALVAPVACGGEGSDGGTRGDADAGYAWLPDANGEGDLGPAPDTGKDAAPVDGLDAPADATPDAAPDDTGGGGGATVRITTKAVATCGSWQPDHRTDVNYQTPTGMRAGVSSVALLRAHRDDEAVSLPLAAPIVEVDLSAGDVLVDANDVALPPGTYTHVRVGLAWDVWDVRATAHQGMDVAGTLTIDMALAPHTSADGTPRAQGQYTATFSAFGQTFSQPGMTPFNCALSAWGGIADFSAGGFDVTVPIPGGPVEVTGGSDDSVDFDLRFPVRDLFAWRDIDRAGFAGGVLDLAFPPAPSELPTTLLECNLLMADRCEGEAVAPVHPSWPMPDSKVRFFTDGTGVVGACPASDAPGYGQDACYEIDPPAYETEGGVVRDLVTGLEWERDADPGSFDWWGARAHCAALAFDGGGWRLPSRVELVSLLEFSRITPTIDVDAFPTATSEFYWTSSPVPFANLAYGVRFELGFIYDHDPFGTGRVRCVRGAYEAPAPRFETTADVVVDHGAGVVWQRASFPAPMAWTDALAACEDLALDDHDDWRLPTLKELQTIVDERELEPSIDPAAFPDTPPEWFWSSTPVEWPPDQAWATSYTDGYASIHDCDELQRVRCVR